MKASLSTECFFSSEITFVKKIDGRVTSTVYQQSFQNCALLVINDTMRDNFISQQDNCSVHVSKSSQNFSEERGLSLVDCRSALQIELANEK